MARLGLAQVLLALALLACTEDKPCDLGSYFVDGVCRPRLDAAADASGTPPSATFGSTCTDHAQCTGEVNACLKRDTDPSGQCSVAPCDTMPGVCPAQWSCCDLGPLQPGAPFGCVPDVYKTALQLTCKP